MRTDILHDGARVLTYEIRNIVAVAEQLERLGVQVYYENIGDPVAKGEESKAKDMLKRLFEYYIAHPEALPEDFQPQLSFDGMERMVCDYIAGMTDNYAVEKFREIFIPMGWQVHG